MPKPINRTIRLDEETEADLQTLAREDRRSLNNMIEVLIVEEVRRRRVIPPVESR